MSNLGKQAMGSLMDALIEDKKDQINRIQKGLELGQGQSQNYFESELKILKDQLESLEAEKNLQLKKLDKYDKT